MISNRCGDTGRAGEWAGALTSVVFVLACMRWLAIFLVVPSLGREPYCCMISWTVSNFVAGSFLLAGLICALVGAIRDQQRTQALLSMLVLILLFVVDLLFLWLGSRYLQQYVYGLPDFF